MLTLKDSEVEDLKETIRSNKELLANTIEATEKNQNEMFELRQELEDLAKSNKIAELRKDSLQKELVEANRGINRINAHLKDAQSKLDDDNYARSVNELIKKQKVFWEVLPTRIKHHIDELGGDLEGFGSTCDPAVATDTLRKINDSNEISDRAVFIRGAVGNYNRCIEDLCKAHIDGRDVPVTQKQQRIGVLDNFLMNKDVSRVWNS